jgi:hypothetical protein
MQNGGLLCRPTEGATVIAVVAVVVVLLVVLSCSSRAKNQLLSSFPAPWVGRVGNCCVYWTLCHKHINITQVDHIYCVRV